MPMYSLLKPWKELSARNAADEIARRWNFIVDRVY